MKQMEKETGLNSTKPLCYKIAKDFITRPPFCPVLTLITAHSNSEQVLQLLGVS